MVKGSSNKKSFAYSSNVFLSRGHPQACKIEISHLSTKINGDVPLKMEPNILHWKDWVINVIKNELYCPQQMIECRDAT